MEEIFKGNKALFEGLYIYDKIDWTQQYPVIRIDWSGIHHSTAESMEISTASFLERLANSHEVTLTAQYASDRFQELIELLHQKTGQQVVVLVDEYDMPILDTLSQPSTIKEARDFLQSFYKVLKTADEHLRFIFLTGVSKFAGVSIFSGLNNLDDITLDEKYAAICGYTQSELENYFSEYLDTVAQYVSLDKTNLMKEIRRWYNGYSWDGETPVYNPFSTLLFFSKKQFDNYWFRTGTPSFLIELLKNRNQLKLVLEPFTVDSIAFESFDPLRIDEVPLLFQTGYLTIKKKEFIGGRPRYTLEMPNFEVEEAFLKYLLSSYSDYPVGMTGSLKERMQLQLETNDAAGLEQSLREMIAYIPYPLHIGKEAYYHSLLLLWLKLLGFDITGEIMTNTGRIDAVLKLPGQVIVAEIKFQPKQGKMTKLLDEAINQIKEKRYYERFKDQKVSFLAVAFAGKEIGCRMESYGIAPAKDSKPE
ncbi:ATPase AAA [Bacteroidia bacterium]|nr:ATPase AAA [Bacteroidia bacterium]